MALPTRIEDIKKIQVEGRRWFNNNKGNTYWSSRISVNDEIVHIVPYAYGYDGQYLDSSLDWVLKELQIDYSGRPAWSYFRDRGIELIYDAVDVNRKKHLAWN